jgi:diguanylate cyclase (GGDEF)-like protein
MTEEVHPAGRHFAGTLTRMVLDHIRDHAPAGSVDDLLRRAGETRSVDELTDDTTWSSYDEFRHLLEAAAAVLGGPERLVDIGESAAIAAGSMPETIEALQGLGSPAALFAALEDGQSGITTILDTQTEERDPTTWVIRNKFKPGFEPFAEFCAFSTGLNSMSPRIFGFTDVDVVEETCTRRGDEYCATVIHWNASDEQARQIAFLQTRCELLERRLEGFQRTVADLVSAEDLETTLSRVVDACARAIRAPAFVLALREMPWSVRRVYAEGIDDERAADIAARVLDPGAGGTLPGVTVEVSSTQRHYGTIFAADPDGSVMRHEVVVLEAYARLAATALDSATSLEEARRQAQTARAQAALSATLAEIASTGEMVANLARAVPAIVDCDRAAFAFTDEAKGTARIVATHGYDPRTATMLLDLEVPFENELIDTMRFYTLDAAPPHLHDLMVANGLVAMAAVSVAIEGATAGSLIAAVTERPERLAPTAELDERLRGLAGLASTALRNTRLVEQIRHQALHDSLTGLPNRALILDRVEQMLSRARRNRTPCAALFIDLDGFKKVNDTFGHDVGDRLLENVAARLTATLRESDTIGRLGGDEFVVLLEESSLDAGPELVAERIREVMRMPFTVRGVGHTTLSVSTSIGIAAGDRSSAADLLRDADVALYQAKAEGKDRFVLFHADMQTAVQDRMLLEMELREALEAGDQLFLEYQPIFNLRDKSMTGVEALVRWRNPIRGVLQPDSFIPIAEETGLVVPLGRWVLNEACLQGARWTAEGTQLQMSVNLSGRQLDSDQVIDDVRTAVLASGVDPSTLTLEITETVLMRDATATAARLAQLKELGVHLAIDDFGTGYSSLAHLQQFPVDALKIDQSFIARIAESPESAALIRTLVQLGKTLGLETVAEGIEEHVQLRSLQRESCDTGQGFLFARPLDAGAVSALFASASPVTVQSDGDPDNSAR